MKNRKWHLLPPASAEELAPLSSSVEGNLLIAQLLHNRGLTNPRDAELFLSPNEYLCHDPFLMNDMEKAVRRIIQSLIGGQMIAVYGDYDADGITSTVLLVQVLTHLGGTVIPYIPRRLGEGYGLNRHALGALAESGVRLIISVDCGTNAMEELDFARSSGLDVIVTDHHTVGSELPPSVALLNPKRPDSTYPFRDLASVGVAFKLAQALLRSMDGTPDLREDDLLDLVALGTIADLAPLVGENRYLVKRGLDVINSTNRIGLQNVVWRAGLQLGTIDTAAVGYVLGPRLNAAGRIDDAIQSYKLLATTDAGEARQLAIVLEEKNAERQRMTNSALAFASQDILPTADRSPILVSSSRNYPSGILGLVAGKLVDQYYKPAIVIEERDDECHGSARSIPEFNIVEALNSCRDLLVRFGGHAQAAGFTIRRVDLPRFQDRLVALGDAALGGMELQPSLTVEAEAELSSFNGRAVGMLHRLAPFGFGNPTPILLSRGVRVLESRAVGSRGDHLKLRLFDGRISWHAIGFGLGEHAGLASRFIDVVYSLEETTWNGEKFIQLRVNDLRPSGE